MPLQLVKLDAFPREVALTKTGTIPQDGAFYLDFTRPLERQRALGFGPTLGMLVPVVHQGERDGEYVVSVRRGAPYFGDIQSRWQQRYPASRTEPEVVAEGLKVIADFAAQFPEDSQ